MMIADGTPLPVGRHSLLGEGNLKLAGLQPEDSGQYRCSIVTTSGNTPATPVSAQATLTVLGKVTFLASFLNLVTEVLVKENICL